MLRLLWKTLATLLLLGLLYVVGHAASGLSGPRTSYQQAQAAFADSRFSEAIRLLSNALAALAADESLELRADILSMRGQAFLQIQDMPLAIRDFEAVYELEPEDEQLNTTLVFSLISNRQPEEALVIAAKYLEYDPGFMRMHELSGEAEQMIYQSMIQELRDQLDFDLGPRALAQAIESIRPWLYRDNRDPEAILSREVFDQTIRDNSPKAAAANSYDPTLRAIRARIKRAMEFYRRALELGGEPVAAYMGLAYALEQGGRLDDLQALAETYLLRFKHWRAVEAAVDLTGLHLESKRYRATVDASDRYVPPDNWRRVPLGWSVRHVLDAKSAAMQALENYPGLVEVANMARDMEEDEERELDLNPEYFFIQLREREAAGDPAQESENLTALRQSLPYEPPDGDLKDKLILVLRMQIANAIKFSASRQGTEFLFERWLELDGEHKDVHLAHARYLMDLGEYPSAFAAAQHALALDNHDEESFAVYTRTADAFYHQSRRGSRDLLMRCISLEQLVPEVVTDSHLLLPMVELALEQGYYAIAQASAQEATEIFNWARWPKNLLVRAYLEDGRASQAIQAAEALLAFHPNDAEGIRSLRKAREVAGLPTDDLLFNLLLIGERDEKMARALLSLAEMRGDPDLEEQLAKTILSISPGDLHAYDRLAAMQYRQGQMEAAQVTLAGIIELARETEGEIAAYAMSRSFLLNLLTGGDEDLEQEFSVVLRAAAEYPQLATELANDLAILGFPAEASLLLEPILFRPDLAEIRSAVHFLLGARLAIRDGRNSDAIAHLKSARSFTGGQDANLILAVLNLRLNNGADALEALGEGPAQDILSASLAARLGRSDMANAWVRPWVAHNPLDFKARVLRAILDPAIEGSPWIRPVIDAAALEVLEILISLAADGFEGQALASAEDLLEKFPEEPLPLFLYAEALVAAGAERRALGTHAQLISRHREFAPSYMRIIRLVARIAGQKGRDLELLPRQASTLPGIAVDPDYKRILRIIPRELIDLSADDWIRSAGQKDLGVAEVNFLAAVGMPVKATLLGQVLTSTSKAADLELWRAYLRSAAELFGDPAQDEILTRAREAAVGNIAQGRAIASSAQFLIAMDHAQLGPIGERRDLERIDQLLDWVHAHAEAALQETVDNAYGIDVSLKLLAQLRGRDLAVQEIEKILAEDPSNIELWMLRARWLAEKGLPEAGLAGLEGILDFAPQSQAVLTVAELAARSGDVDLRRIEEMLGNLPASLRESPQGKLSRGLLALRDARYEEADDLLADCRNPDDGAALYYRALANLSLARSDVARQLFLELASNYPDSSLAVNAEHFANQLSH